VDDPDSCERGTNPGRTYRFFEGTPVVEFGFGLSYTTFTYAVAGEAALDLAPVREMLEMLASSDRDFPRLEDAKAAAGEGYVVSVTNAGGVDADEVVLGFSVPPGAGEDGVEIKHLFGFERVHVKAGETVQVTLVPGLSDFTHVNQAGEREARAGEYRIQVGVQGAAFAEHVVVAKGGGGRGGGRGGERIMRGV
jgi:hypothetical protein